MSCVECGVTQNLQVHHLSYYPPETELLCISCHEKRHNHGTGKRISKDVLKRKDELENIQQQTEQTLITLQIPTPMKVLIEKLVSVDTYSNMSEFIRDAIRQKIQREHPGLIQQLVKDELTA